MAKKYAIQYGPLFLEAITYRYHDHSMSDPGLTYRTRDQVQQHKQKQDPISLVKQFLLQNNLVTESDIKVNLQIIHALQKQCISHVKKQVQLAQNDPFPTEADLLSHVYANTQECFMLLMQFLSKESYMNNPILRINIDMQNNIFKQFIMVKYYNNF